MKRKLKYLFCLFFALASCKKKNEVTPIPANTITVAINGVNSSFNINASGSFGGAPGTSTLNITGQSSASYPGKTINVSLTSTDFNAIAIGTFIINTANNRPNVLPSVLTTEESDPNSNSGVFNTDLSGKNITTIAITAISSTNVQGTFSGTLVSYLDGAITETVTNGKFNVNIK